ncbi:thermonuclease family protein [Rhizobium wuzhouense]|nr:thermonuclease family protein [Rhizobium wuzhouense]
MFLFMGKFSVSAIYFLILGFGTSSEAATRFIDGPVEAQVIRVIDGDTVLVDAMPWPDHHISTYVRLRGIDAPELKSKCAAFRNAARQAQEQLMTLMVGQPRVTLTAISGDKYFGRVVADLNLDDGRRPADLLLEGGLVEPYHGKTKSKRPCPDS